MEYKNLVHVVPPSPDQVVMKSMFDNAMMLLERDKFDVFAVTTIVGQNGLTFVVVSGKKP